MQEKIKVKGSSFDSPSLLSASLSTTTYQLSMASQDNPSKLFIDLYSLWFITVSVSESTSVLHPSSILQCQMKEVQETSWAKKRNLNIDFTFIASEILLHALFLCHCAIGSHNYFNTFFVACAAARRRKENIKMQFVVSHFGGYRIGAKCISIIIYQMTFLAAFDSVRRHLFCRQPATAFPCNGPTNIAFLPLPI